MPTRRGRPGGQRRPKVEAPPPSEGPPGSRHPPDRPTVSRSVPHPRHLPSQGAPQGRGHKGGRGKGRKRARAPLLADAARGEAREVAPTVIPPPRAPAPPRPLPRHPGEEPPTACRVLPRGTEMSSVQGFNRLRPRPREKRTPQVRHGGPPMALRGLEQDQAGKATATTVPRRQRPSGTSDGRGKAGTPASHPARRNNEGRQRPYPFKSQAGVVFGR